MAHRGTPRSREQPLARRDLKVDQPGQRQVDLFDLEQVEFLAETAQLEHFVFGQLHRRRHAQRAPLTPVELHIGARLAQPRHGVSLAVSVVAMEPGTLIREYLLLGLRFDRIEEGYVDSFTGDPRCASRCRTSPRPIPPTWPVRPSGLAAEVRSPTASIRPRADYLAAHLRALACAGRKFAGQDVGFVDEVEAYFDVHIAKGDPEQLPAGAPQARRGAGRQRTARRADAGLPRGRGDPARTARGSHPRVLQRAARPGARRIPAARHRDHHLRGGHRQAVVGVQLLPRRLPLHRRRQRRPQTADVQPAPAGRARVLSRPPHRALPQGSRAGRGQGPGRADHLPGQHAAVPDGRGAGGPRPARRDRAGLGRLGRARSTPTSGCGSTASAPRRCPKPRPRWPTSARTPR